MLANNKMHYSNFHIKSEIKNANKVDVSLMKVTMECPSDLFRNLAGVQRTKKINIILNILNDNVTRCTAVNQRSLVN